MRTRASAARVATLGTVTAAGEPRLVPCCFAIEDDEVFTAVDDIKPKSTLALQRLARIAGHPSVCLLIDHYSEDWSALWWVRIDGQARVLAPRSPDRGRGLELLARKYPQYRDRPPTGAAMVVSALAWRGWP